MILESLQVDDMSVRVMTDCGLVRLGEYRDEFGRMSGEVLVQAEAGFELEASVVSSGTVLLRWRERGKLRESA